MMYRIRHAIPDMITRGVAQTLSLRVEDGTGSVSVSSGTFTLLDGGSVVLTGSVSPGSPATYSLVSTDTASRSTSSVMLERWELEIAGSDYVFERPAMLVRCAYIGQVTDTDLRRRHPDIDDHLPASAVSFDDVHVDAVETIERDLLRRGKRPDLIFDRWAVWDAELYLTLHIIFQASALSLGDGRYKELAADYLKRYGEEMDRAVFRYDTEEAGTISDRTSYGASAPVFASAGRRRSSGWVL